MDAEGCGYVIYVNGCLAVRNKFYDLCFQAVFQAFSPFQTRLKSIVQKLYIYYTQFIVGMTVAWRDMSKNNWDFI